ncbi:hypothetical protein EIP86_011020 [Pleurotus ostreatoroseus]|nr:hypothetical protein EIP86_011020 [Pleurotus ostreatoroseus]
MKAAGAEADGASVLAQAEDEGWIKTELFKLRLRPKSMTLKMNGMRLSPLPEHKTAVDVFGDFLSYLFRCTHSFIVDTHANGHALWRAVENDIQFVLSHPNGWEGAQQTKMRRAAVLGGLIPDTDEGKSRIRFVTEGEASLHACVLNGLAADVLSNPSGHGFIVADAGGGTLDISSYAIRGTSPLVIEEIAPPDYHIAKRFDETTKRLFRDNKELQFVPFGSPLDKDLTVGIRGGQLKLTGDEVAALFEPSIEAAIASIKAQINASSSPVKGSLSVDQIVRRACQSDKKKYHVDAFPLLSSKAVADGAIGFYCDHHVSARVAKFMYGVEYLRAFDPNDAEHSARKHRLFEMPSGPKLLPDAFDSSSAQPKEGKNGKTYWNIVFSIEIQFGLTEFKARIKWVDNGHVK